MSGGVRYEPSREKRQHPFHEQGTAIADAEELHEVVHAPDRPGRKTADDEAAEPGKLGARLRAAERDEVALAVIDERLGGLAPHERGEIAGGGRRFENGDLCELRQRLSAVLEIGGIAEDQYVVAPIRPKPVVHHDAAVLGLRKVDRRDQRIHLDTTRPDDRPGAKLRTVLRMHDSRADLGYERVQEDPYALLLEPLHRDRREPRIHRGQDTV